MSDEGFSLIELLVGISIMAVVGSLISTLLGSSTRLYRSAISNSNVQAESQFVSRRIGNAIMEAKSIYLYEQEDGSYLFTGERKAGAGQATYSGQIFWFNRETGCLYQDSSFRAVEDSDKAEHDKTGRPGAPTKEGAKSGVAPILTAETVRRELEENGGNGRAYLISDKVRSLDFAIYPELTREERIREGSHYYIKDSDITVYYDILFLYQDSKSHSVSSCATPRNRIEVLWCNTFDVEDGEE